jgi:single-stranded-DNA-specific exonuclease
MMAVAREYFDDTTYQNYLRESIDIAAIGTVADCMQLTGENRIIVTEGLKQLKHSRSKGIRQLIEDKIHEDLDADVFGFLIGPRLNAAGRMDSPYKAVNLILNNGKSLPQTLREIEELNTLRKAKTAEFVEYALEDIDTNNNIIFYHSPDIEHGIIGIVAGRLTEKYYKPSIVLIDEGEKLVASCRSPDYFSIVDILETYKEYFIAFGGHRQAAGFSILKEKYSEFREKITAELNAQDFSKYKKEIHIDKCLRLDEIGFNFLEKINHFKPFGMGNPKPLFLIEDFISDGVKFLGKGRDHLKFESRYGFKILAFGLGEHYDILKKRESFDIICELAEDSWQNQRNIMIRVVDIVL